MLSLQQRQSYLGLILVEKEETLAASCRSTFVSKYIKTEMEKKWGVGKAEGGDECWVTDNREETTAGVRSKGNISAMEKSSPFEMLFVKNR